MVIKTCDFQKQLYTEYCAIQNMTLLFPLLQNNTTFQFSSLVYGLSVLICFSVTYVPVYD